MRPYACHARRSRSAADDRGRRAHPVHAGPGPDRRPAAAVCRAARSRGPRAYVARPGHQGLGAALAHAGRGRSTSSASFIRLNLIRNPGAAFSIGDGVDLAAHAHRVRRAGVVVIRTRATVGSTRLGRALGLLLGGVARQPHRPDGFREPGPGRGHVVDFIDYFGLFIGNVADIAIVVRPPWHHRGPVRSRGTVVSPARSAHHTTRAPPIDDACRRTHRPRPRRPRGRARRRRPRPAVRGLAHQGRRPGRRPATSSVNARHRRQVPTGSAPATCSRCCCRHRRRARPSRSSPSRCPGMGIIHDDDDIVVVDKPVGVAAHPSVGWTGPDRRRLASPPPATASRPAGRASGRASCRGSTSAPRGLMVVAPSPSTPTRVLKQAFRSRTRRQDLPRARPGPARPASSAPSTPPSAATRATTTSSRSWTRASRASPTTR